MKVHNSCASHFRLFSFLAPPPPPPPPFPTSPPPLPFRKTNTKRACNQIQSTCTFASNRLHNPPPTPPPRPPPPTEKQTNRKSACHQIQPTCTFANNRLAPPPPPPPPPKNKHKTCLPSKSVHTHFCQQQTCTTPFTLPLHPPPPNSTPPLEPHPPPKNKQTENLLAIKISPHALLLTTDLLDGL